MTKRLVLQIRRASSIVVVSEDFLNEALRNTLNNCLVVEGYFNEYWHIH